MCFIQISLYKSRSSPNRKGPAFLGEAKFQEEQREITVSPTRQAWHSGHFREDPAWGQGLECYAICLLYLFVAGRVREITVDDCYASGVVHDGGDSTAGAEGFAGDQFGVLSGCDAFVSRGQCAVYGNRRTGNIASHIACQKQGQIGALSGIAHSPGGCRFRPTPITSPANRLW